MAYEEDRDTEEREAAEVEKDLSMREATPDIVMGAAASND